MKEDSINDHQCSDDDACSGCWSGPCEDSSKEPADHLRRNFFLGLALGGDGGGDGELAAPALDEDEVVEDVGEQDELTEIALPRLLPQTCQVP